jgi:xanthine dehydrogenase small subunit
VLSASRSDIRFWHRGALVSITGVSPQRTVLRWLREDLGLLGTKEGCGEGDCGACTVAVGTLDPTAPQGVRIRAVNACLLFLPALDGKALFTVEDVAAGPDLHPVQRALVDLHASQCGFCTPGFVMSLWADYQGRTSAPNRSETESTLSGNLCRCTGYRPLVEAAEAAWTYPLVKNDRHAVGAALQAVAAEPALAYEAQGQRWTAPRTIDDLAAAVEAAPDARIIAGATDLGLQVTKGLKDLGHLISTGSVAELKTIATQGDLVIGAAASLTDAWAAIAGRHPELADFARRFASTPVRNAGTLGGNVANGSPIGDSMPVLLALGASVVLRRGTRERTLALEDYYLGYQKTAREPGEVLTALRIPPLSPNAVVRAWKVSKRRDQDISAVCGAFVLELKGTTVVSARIGYGGMAAIPSRARGAEAALTGRPFDAGALEAAQTALGTDFRPLTDGRATDAYRRTVAANLLTRLQAEVIPQAVHP